MNERGAHITILRGRILGASNCNFTNSNFISMRRPRRAAYAVSSHTTRYTNVAIK